MFGLQFINEMENMQRQMDQFFGSVSRADNRNDLSLRVKENEQDYEVRVVVPGLDAEKLDISIIGRELKISGSNAAEEIPEGAHFHRQERRHGDFEKMLRLGDGVDTEKVDAEYRNGILTIRLPKIQAAQPKRIAVNVG